MKSITTRVTKVQNNIEPVAIKDQISLYLDSPNEEITLDEFQTYAYDRLQVLRKLDSFKLKGFQFDDIKKSMKNIIEKYLPLKQYGKATEAIRKDQISHFILRLAYCRSEDLRRWFLNTETTLFRLRLESLTHDKWAEWMQENGFDYHKVSDEEKREKQSYFNLCSNQVNFHEDYFRIPFTEAIELVSSRSVYLEGGNVYVPVSKLLTILCGRFRTHLAHELMIAASSYPMISKDQRLGPILNNMNQQYVGKEYLGTKDVNEVKPEMLDRLAQRSMPLCMRQLHVGLKRDHKLRHWGRLQYGLFLKGAGLTLEDAITFFRTEFCQIMSTDEFDKGYLYNIRHGYGREGKRTSYTPYSCQKIILSNGPGPGDHHGCPFRHYDQAHLSSLLRQMKLNDGQINDINDTVKNRHYQLACTKYFEITHPDANSETYDLGNHPNAYMEASLNYWKEKNKNNNNNNNNANLLSPNSKGSDIKGTFETPSPNK